MAQATHYQASSHLGPGIYLPDATAFNIIIIFDVGIALALLFVAISAATKNYTFARSSNSALPPSIAVATAKAEGGHAQ